MARTPLHATRPLKPQRKPLVSILPIVLILGIAVSWAYGTSFSGVFVLDDWNSIADNAHIRHLWPLRDTMSAPPEASVSGRPLVSLSLALNYALAPEDARDVMAPAGPGAPPGTAERFLRNISGYHAFNILIHLAAALTLFGVIRRTFLIAPLRERYERRAAGMGIATALLWAVHPLNTESVTYIVQRLESLMGLFYLLTLYCAIRAATSSGPHRSIWTAAAVVACACGMGSKEVMISAPILVMIWDRVARVEVRSRLSLYAGLASTWFILLVLLKGEVRPSSVGFHLGWTWWEYLTTQAAVIVHYVRLVVWPSPLVFDYGWPKMPVGQIVPQGVVLLLLLAATVAGIVKRHPLAVPGAAFFMILAPTSSVLPIVTEVAAEHRMYLPGAVVVAVLVAIGDRALDVVPRRNSMIRHGVAGLLVGVLAVAFAQMTRARSLDYSSEERLWMDTIQKRPENARARVGYGIALMSARRFADAEAVLREALRLDTADAKGQMNLGSALAAQGRLDEGIQHLQQAVELDPSLKEPYGLLGEAFSERGETGRALEYFNRAVEALPDNAALLARVSWFLATLPDDRLRDGARAERLARRAIELSGERNVVFIDTLGVALAEQGRFPEAIEVAQQAIAAAQSQGQTAFIPELQQRLALYLRGHKVPSGR